jgi:hypothetical protein
MRIWQLRIREDTKATMNSNYKKKHIALTYVFWKIIQAHKRNCTPRERQVILEQLAERTHRDMNIFDVEIFLLPANITNSHWIWFLIHPETRSIHCYDGFHNSYKRYFDFLLNWLEIEAAKTGVAFCFVRDEWKFFDEYGPTQINMYDCGMYMLKGIEYVCDNLRLDYSQQHMPSCRMEMLLDLVDGRLGRANRRDPFTTDLDLGLMYVEQEDLMLFDAEDQRNMEIELDWSEEYIKDQAAILKSIQDPKTRTGTAEAPVPKESAKSDTTSSVTTAGKRKMVTKDQAPTPRKKSNSRCSLCKKTGHNKTRCPTPKLEWFQIGVDEAEDFSS